jgi:hypothetical protein
MILCYYALGERDKMKRGFQMLLECPLNIDDDEKYNATSVSTPYIKLLYSVYVSILFASLTIQFYRYLYKPTQYTFITLYIRYIEIIESMYSQHVSASFASQWGFYTRYYENLKSHISDNFTFTIWSC